MTNIDNIYKKNGFVINLGLERIKTLLNHAGNPQDKLKIIHVGGTNGKGSVSRFIYSILKEHGLKTGLYISPHLLNFNERIIINDKKITNADIENIRQFFNEIVNKNKEEFEGLGKPTFFEITTAICFKYFFDNNVDIAIVEVGLGGNLDATNVIPPPLISIITNISMDHKDVLGNSLEKIASDKAGIIKENSITITGERKKKLVEIFRKKTIRQHSVFFSAGEVKLLKAKGFYTYKGHNLLLSRIKLVNQAFYQKYNLKLALLSVEILNDRYKSILNLNLKDDLIRKGILKFKNEGRFEVMKYKNADVILDGAHNPDGIKNLTISLKKTYNRRGFIFIFAVMKDKDYKVMLKRLSKLEGIIIFAGLDNERQMNINELKFFTERHSSFKRSFASENVKEGFELALKNKEDNELIVICGSLYLVGEFKKLKKYSRED